MYFSEEKVLINLFTTFSGNYVSFIMFNSGNNFSNPSPLFLESECSLGEPSAESSLRLLLKKLLGWFFLQVKHYQVYYLERSKVFFQWLQDVSMWWFLLWVININCLGVFHKIKNDGKSKLWPLWNPGQPQHPGRDQDMALKSQQWLLEQRARYFCAAFLKLLPLSSGPWPWSKLPEINGKAHVDFGGI